MAHFTIRPALLMTAALSALAAGAAAHAWQPPASEEPVAPPPPEVDPGIVFAVGSGLEYQFRTNIDDGGRFSALRFNAGIQARTQINPDLNLTLGFRYDFDDYRFSGLTALAPGGAEDPWDDVHTLTFSGILSLSLDNEFAIFGGPVMQFSRESGASWSDSFIAGGAIGATYAASPDLTIGGGLGIVTQIEDSVRLFPVVILDWVILDNLRLTTQTVSAATGDTGLELVYNWGGGLETAIGAAYRFRRFRLDDGGAAPKGVGQDTRVPIWVRLGYHFSPQFSANLYGGVLAGGQLRLEDENGSRLGSADYDPAAVVGVSASFRF